MFKWLIFLMFGFILYNLFRGLYFLVHDKGKSKKTVRSLTYRVGLSIALIVLLVIGAAVGWIKPHNLSPTLLEQNAR